MDKFKKIKNLLESREYNIECAELALHFCPEIYPCFKCGHPVITGYCCTTCGDTDPLSKE